MNNPIGGAVGTAEVAHAVKEQLTKAALQPVGNAPAELDAVIRKEVDYWGKAAQALGIKPQ